MSDQKVCAEEWLSCAKRELALNKAKSFKSSDLIVEWKAEQILSLELAAFKKSAAPLACRELAAIEVQFLKAYPEAAIHEMFLKPCAPLLHKDLKAVDWKSVQETIQSTIRQFFLADAAAFGEALIKPLLEDIYILIELKKAGELFGFGLLSITPALSFGTVKLINLVTTAEGRKSNLDHLLLSSLFKILPSAEEIFLYMRPTNPDLKRYLSWGFTEDSTPVQDLNHKVNMNYLTLLKYKTDSASSLQDRAKDLSV